MATVGLNAYISPLERILQKAESHGLKPTAVSVPPQENSQLLKSLKALAELHSQLSAKQQLLLAAQRASSHPNGSNLANSAGADVLLILERMSDDLTAFTSHMDSVLEKKDILTNYLQTPISSDCLIVEAEHQAEFRQLYQSVSSSLVQLPNTFSILEWAAKFSLADSQLDRKLWSLCTLLAKCQRYHEALNVHSGMIKELL